MLLHQPTPDAVLLDIEVECSETDGLRRCRSRQEFPPSPQNRIEFLEKLRQRDQSVLAPLVICFTVCRRSARLASWYLGSSAYSRSTDATYSAPVG